MAAATARRSSHAEAQGLASHGMSRVPQYAAHLRNGRADGDALPGCRRGRGRRGARRRPVRPGLSGVRARRGRGDPSAHASSVSASSGVTNSHHFGVAADHLCPVARAGMVGLAFGNSPAAMPAAGGKHPIFGTNPIAAIFPRDARRSADDRPVAVGSRARQGHGRGQGRPADSAGLGARPRRPADHRRQGGAGRIDAGDGRHQGCDARADRRVACVRADRRGDGFRGRLFLRRRRQSAAHRPGLPGDRSRRARRARGLSRARSRR